MMAGSKTKIRKYLDVEKNKVKTKIPARVVLDLNDYKDITESYGEEVGINEIDNVYELPGFFTIEFPEEGDSIDFFLPYTIFMQKTAKIQQNKDQLIIDFKPGEMIFYANFKQDETNIYILKSLFANGVKYLGDKPDKLITAIWDQMMPSNTPWHHLELIVSQLYGTYDSKTKEILPLRLTSHNYSKKYIMNLNKSAHDMTQTMPIMYGYSKDALRSMIQKKKRGKNSFFENIVSGNYDEMTKDHSEKLKEDELKKNIAYEQPRA